MNGEGEGDGGALGSKGRNETLPSASRMLGGNQVDILASEGPLYPYFVPIVTGGRGGVTQGVN